MRSAILATILIATVFSGCLAEPSNTQTVTTSDSPTPSTSGSTSTNAPSTSATPTPTTTTAAAENTAPTANLTSDVSNGTAPLNVTFTIQGDDENGDELSWTLDVDGDNESDYNGTDIPTAVVHEFLEAGNFTAVLTVTDGTDSATANLTIVVEAAAAAGPLVCDRPGAMAVGPFYVVSEGGDWVFEESNGMPGLQVENNHPIGEPFWVNPAWVDCSGGDQMIN